MRFKTTHLSALLTVAFLFPSVGAAQTVEWIRMQGTSEFDYSYGVSADPFGNVFIVGLTDGDIDGDGPGRDGGRDNPFVSKYDGSGTLEWTRQFVPGLGDANTTGVSTDALGNVYISGYTRSDVDGAGPATPAGNRDAFLIKYDSSGVRDWARQIGTSGNDRGLGVSTDSFGNVYLSGDTSGDIDGAGPGTNAGGGDAFVAKYDGSGVLEWTRQLGTTENDESWAVSTDPLGNVYITGRTEGDLDGAGPDTNAGRQDVFLSKYDSSGTLAWTRQFGSSEFDYSHAMTTDGFGNVYVSGYTNGDIDGAGPETHVAFHDAFVTKFDSSGTLAWTRQVGTNGDERSYGVATDALGNVYISGYTDGDLDGAGPETHAGKDDAYIMKYDSSGTLAWTKQLGTDSYDLSWGVSTDAFGNVYFTGYTGGDFDGTGTGPIERRSEVFLVKINDGPELSVDELVSRGSEWSYLDNGTNQGTAWRDRAFDDSAWEAGPAELGYGDGQATEVSFGGDAGNKHVTTYFRHWFEVDDASRVLQLTLDLLRDDGAAVYLNGVEVRRDNLNPNAPYNDLATDTVGGAEESSFFSSIVDPLLLRDGMNLLAVEVHQANAGSSDISFDLSLTARINPVPEPGTLSMLAIGLIPFMLRRKRRAEEFKTTRFTPFFSPQCSRWFR